MKKKEYVKPAMNVVEIESEGIIAASSGFIGISDEDADYEMEVLSKGRSGRDDDDSWGNFW